MKLTDTEKTLELLKAYGSRGCHSFILNKLVGTTRSAARINDLKNLGYQIDSTPEVMDGSLGCRYFLKGNPIKQEVARVKRYVFDNQTNTVKEVWV